MDDKKEKLENIGNESGCPVVPYAAFQMQMDMAYEERKLIRKHYKHIIIGVCLSFCAIILTLFGIAAYILHRYDFVSCYQLSEYGNANYIGNDGDNINGGGADDILDGGQESPTEGNSDWQK